MENKPKYLEASQKTVIVDVSPEEYQADLRKGLAEDETLAPGRHVFRRGGFLRRHANATIATATWMPTYWNTSKIEHLLLIARRIKHRSIMRCARLWRLSKAKSQQRSPFIYNLCLPTLNLLMPLPSA